MIHSGCFTLMPLHDPFARGGADEEITLAGRLPGASITCVEYRWCQKPWLCFGTTDNPSWTSEMLEACRQHHPGCECRTQEKALPPLSVQMSAGSLAHSLDSGLSIL